MSYREMSDVTRIQYLRSDITVPSIIYDAAVSIYTAFVTNGKVNDKNRDEMMEIAIKQALDLAMATEKIIATAGSANRGV